MVLEQWAQTASIDFRFKDWNNRLRLRLDGYQDRIWLQKIVGGTPDVIIDGGMDNHPTEEGVWYTITMRVAGPYVSVSRQQDGGPKQFIFETFEAPVFDNKQFLIEVEGGRYRFDEIKIKTHNNLSDFLHLSGDASTGEYSPAINRTDPNASNEFLRDFDDQHGPIDGSPLRPGFIADMGADEYPTDPGFTYWWRNF